MSLPTPGKHRARALSASIKTSTSGSAYVEAELELIGTEHKVQWVGFLGSEKATDRTIESLRTMGWRGNNLLELNGLGDIEVEAVVEHETWRNKTRARAKYINRLRDNANSRAIVEKAARRVALLIAAREGADGGNEGGDDDVPF